MEKGDKGSTMIRMGVSGWMFLLVPAYPGCPGSKAIKRSLLLLFEVDMTIHCQVTAFLSADTSREFVTLTIDLLTLNSCCAWRFTWTLLPSLKTLRLSVLELWVITFPVDYHRKCVRGYCACAESRDLPVGGQKQLHFWNPQPWFAYSLCTIGGSTMNAIKVICENNARPCVKRRMSFCACAKSRDLLKVP